MIQNVMLSVLQFVNHQNATLHAKNLKTQFVTWNVKNLIVKFTAQIKLALELIALNALLSVNLLIALLTVNLLNQNVKLSVMNQNVIGNVLNHNAQNLNVNWSAKILDVNQVTNAVNVTHNKFTYNWLECSLNNSKKIQDVVAVLTRIFYN